MRAMAWPASSPARFAAAMPSDAAFCSCAQVLRRGVGGAPVLVEIEDLVEAIGVAAAGERLAHGVGVAADQSQVEHGAPSVRRIHATGRRGNPAAWPRGRAPASLPGDARDVLRDGLDLRVRQLAP